MFVFDGEEQPSQVVELEALGITVFENLEGFPEDWETNAPVFIKN